MFFIRIMRPIYWQEGKVHLIDQSRLPKEEIWLELSDYLAVVNAIKAMRIRGAPALGVAGAYALVLAAQDIVAHDREEFLSLLEKAGGEISIARPTGVNLSWAVQRMINTSKNCSTTENIIDTLKEEALSIQNEDEEGNRRMALYGEELLPSKMAVLTHCNAGSLATGGYGTALGVITTGWETGKISKVFATETRPLLQGARLTTWELAQASIPSTLLTDSAAGQLLNSGEVGCVIVGADSIAANGDVANKVGTYTLAVLAKENKIPFYVAAPTSTIDMTRESGREIPIEERSSEEVVHFSGMAIAPSGIDVRNPAFDVTPYKYVTAIITENGVAQNPYNESFQLLLER